jgi:hypothetical protein
MSFAGPDSRCARCKVPNTGNLGGCRCHWMFGVPNLGRVIQKCWITRLLVLCYQRLMFRLSRYTVGVPLEPIPST